MGVPPREQAHAQDWAVVGVSPGLWWGSTPCQGRYISHDILGWSASEAKQLLLSSISFLLLCEIALRERDTFPCKHCFYILSLLTNQLPMQCNKVHVQFCACIHVFMCNLLESGHSFQQSLKWVRHLVIRM